MARRPKLTQEMVDEAIRLKADGLSNGDIICALGIHESTFYRWIGDPKNRLQRALSEGLKKEESAFKRTLLTTIRSAALARNQYWTAAAWLLERKYPDEFGKAERKGDDAKADAAHRTGSAWWPSLCSRRCRWTGSARGVPMVDASSLVIPAFHNVLGDVMAHGHTHCWLHGGRGSTKSSFISVCIVLLLLAHPEANAVIVRRFSNTLRDSVFQQVTWAIAELGIERWFRARISPMELTYLPTGQRIVFRGADDPLKLKGVKFTRGYAAVVWFEELDQFDGIDAVRSILNSLRRGGEDFWIFYSYNPPRTLWSWVNREKLERERRSDTLVRQSSYLDVIESHPEWLGGPFVEEAEYLREVDEQAWRSEFLLCNGLVLLKTYLLTVIMLAHRPRISMSPYLFHPLAIVAVVTSKPLATSHAELNNNCKLKLQIHPTRLFYKTHCLDDQQSHQALTLNSFPANLRDCLRQLSIMRNQQ